MGFTFAECTAAAICGACVALFPYRFLLKLPGRLGRTARRHIQRIDEAWWGALTPGLGSAGIDAPSKTNAQRRIHQAGAPDRYELVTATVQWLLPRCLEAEVAAFPTANLALPRAATTDNPSVTA